jgi:hypothetical protein
MIEGLGISVLGSAVGFLIALMANDAISRSSEKKGYKDVLVAAQDEVRQIQHSIGTTRIMLQDKPDSSRTKLLAVNRPLPTPALLKALAESPITYKHGSRAFASRVRILSSWSETNSNLFASIGEAKGALLAIDLHAASMRFLERIIEAEHRFVSGKTSEQHVQETMDLAGAEWERFLQHTFSQ